MMTMLKALQEYQPKEADTMEVATDRILKAPD